MSRFKKLLNPKEAKGDTSDAMEPVLEVGTVTEADAEPSSTTSVSPARPAPHPDAAPKKSKRIRPKKSTSKPKVDSLEGMIADHERFNASGFRPRPPCSRHCTPIPFGTQLLRAVKDRIVIVPESQVTEYMAEAFKPGFQLWFAEWKAFLGPDPLEPLAPPVAFRPNLEGGMFPTLFPYGIGYWLGPTGHPTPLTFEEYALHRLVTVDRRPFVAHLHWLTWALTQSDDRDFATTINCALAVYHGVKARHLGRGKVQTLRLEEDFEVARLVGGELVVV